MQGDIVQQKILDIQWLFDKRINLFSPQFNLTKATNRLKIHQNYSIDVILHLHTKIKAAVDLENIYKLLNKLLANFYLYDENKIGRGQAIKKKNIKQAEKESNKIKKFLDLFRINHKEEQEWRKILKIKNVINLLKNVYRIYFCILQQNFELDERIIQSRSSNLPNFAFLKEKQLGHQLQFRICLLALDIIKIIKTIRLTVLPYSHQQIKTNGSDQQFQTQKFDSYFQEIKEPSDFASMYKTFKNLSEQVFIQTLKQIERSLSPQYKLCINIYQIKKDYLIDENNGLLFKKTYKSKLQSTVVKQLQLYWLFYQAQYRNSQFEKKNVQEISLEIVFEDYISLFQQIVEEAVANQAKIQEILNFFNLVKGPWKQLDYESSLKIFWKCLLILEGKIKLSSQYLAQSKNFLIEVYQNRVDLFEQQRNQQIKQQLKTTLLSLSRQLIQLSQNQNFMRDYLQSNRRRISKILSKFNQYQATVKQCQKMVKEINQSNILTYFKNIEQKLTQTPTNLPNLTYKEQQKIFIIFQSIFQEQKEIIDQIKYFLAMQNGQNLQECSKYYRCKRQKYLKKGQIKKEDINSMTFGIVSSIRVAIFGLITTIKLQQNPQVHYDGKSQDSLEQQRLERLIQKLLKVYHRKNKYLKRKTANSGQEDQDNDQSLPLMRRMSSLQVNQNEFQIEQQLLEIISQKENQDEQFEDDQFRLKLLKIIFEIKIEVINKKVLQLEDIELPLRNQYENIKKRVYAHAYKILNFQSKQDIEILPRIEYELTRKRMQSAWRKLTSINRGNLQEIQKILEVSWGTENNILKFYIALLLKYRERQPQTQKVYERISEQEQIRIVNFVLQAYKIEGEERKKLRKDLLSSLKILQSFQQTTILKNIQKQQMEKIKSIEQAKQFEVVKANDTCFNKWIDNKLSIVQIKKNGVPISRKYTIIPSAHQYDTVLKKMQKLTKMNKYINLTKEKKQIYLHVDQHQIEFQSYPKLVKYLIESYYQTVEFCYQKLQFELYPLVWSKHIIIGKVKENHPTLRFNPYQGIILNLLFSFDQLKKTHLYQYPQFPFIEFAEQINRLFTNEKKHKIYNIQNRNAEYYAFVHLIEQMKSLSLQQLDNNLQQTYKNILKCPYFWSQTQKFYELVQFKEKYHSNVNIEESRRKQNQKIRAELKKENRIQYQSLINYLRLPEKKQKHPNFKSMSGYNRTTQIYLSIQGLIEKQAFEEDIGNFRQKDARGELRPQEYKYHTYWWIKNKKEIVYLLELVSERQRRRGSKKSSVYQKTFNSFQNQIRNLRNLAVHYIYDSKNEKQITIEQKIRLFEQNFPKLFVFMYRWKPFIGKDYNQIQSEKIDLLCQLFPNKENNQVIQKLETIKQLQEYNIPNYKINQNQTSTLLREFNYDRSEANGCYICGLISMLLFKRQSFWGFLSDAKYPKIKDGKQVLYNVLFWDHKSEGCNGMQYLERAFYNVSQRYQFTSQELAEVQQSQIMLKIQKQRIQKKLQKLRNNQQSSDQQERQYKAHKESVEVRYYKLSEDEKIQLHQELALTDYVPKYFIFQLQMKFPYLFYDLRRFRYLWDRRAKELPTNNN